MSKKKKSRRLSKKYRSSSQKRKLSPKIHSYRGKDREDEYRGLKFSWMLNPQKRDLVHKLKPIRDVLRKFKRKNNKEKKDFLIKVSTALKSDNINKEQIQYLYFAQNFALYDESEDYYPEEILMFIVDQEDDSRLPIKIKDTLKYNDLTTIEAFEEDLNYYKTILKNHDL